MITSYLSFLISTALICLLLSVANTMLAVRSRRFSAAAAHAIAFAAMSLTWLLTAVLPQEPRGSNLMTLLLLNSIGAIGAVALWGGLHLRAGYRINAYLMGALFWLWITPVLGTVLVGFGRNTHVPFAAASIVAGAVWSTWRLCHKRVAKNAGDWALILWMILAIPVFLLGVFPAINIGHNGPPAAWSLYLGFLPTIFAGIGLFTLVGVALDALSDSHKLARTDALTGLLNRRAFDGELSIAIARAKRYQREVSLIVLDMDAFKALNDNHGHPAGDTVLREVAQVMVSTARRIDLINRIGGEEFALILPDTPASAALQLAERLRQAIENKGADSLAYTASFGVSNTQDTGLDSEALLQAADDALYAAKNAGRNRVRYARHPEAEPEKVMAVLS